MGKKKVLWIISGFLALLFLLFFLLSKPISEFASYQLVKVFRNQGIRSHFGSLETFLSGVHGSEIDLWFGPLNVIVDRLSVSPRFSRVLAGRIGIVAEGSAYNGELVALGDLGSDTINGSGTFKNVHLELHPQISGFGITSAIAALDLKEVLIVRGVAERARGELTISQITLPVIPTFGFPVKLPPLSSGNISGEFQLDDKIRLENFTFTSSLGKLEGNFEMTRPDKKSDQPGATGKFQVKISDSLLPAIGSFLPLISNGKLTAATSQFSVTIVGKPCRGAYSPIKFAGLCTEAIYSPLAKNMP